VGDLPDYHSYVTPVTVNIPAGEEPESRVAKYQTAPADLPDGSLAYLLTDVKGRLIVVQHEKDRTVETASGKYVRVKGPATDEVPATIETLSGKFVRVKGPATDAVPVSLADQEIIVRPKGGILAKGSITSAAAYATVATRTVTSGKQFQLSKIVVSASKAAWVKFRWNAADISAERNLDDKTLLIEHFPWDYYEMDGDGAKAFDVQAKYDSEAGTVNVEIVGEEV